MKYFQLSNWANFSSGLYSLLGVTKVISKGLICGPCLKADQTWGRLASRAPIGRKVNFLSSDWIKVFTPSSNLSNIFWCLLRVLGCHKSWKRGSRTVCAQPTIWPAPSFFWKWDDLLSNNNNNLNFKEPSAIWWNLSFNLKHFNITTLL